MENKESMETVKALMADAEKVRLGGKHSEAVMIDYTSYFGNACKGPVVFKRPTMRDYLKMGALKSEYLRKEGVVDINLVDGAVKYMAHVMAVLTVVIVKCPEWLLKLEEIQEPDVLYHVHDKYEEWERSFRRIDKTESDGDSESSEGTADLGA